jgi:hypothetical protein
MIRATAAGVSAHAGLTCYFLISSFVVPLSVCLKIAYPPLAILIGRTWKGFTGFQATVLFVPFRLVENWRLGESSPGLFDPSLWADLLCLAKGIG